MFVLLTNKYMCYWIIVAHTHLKTFLTLFPNIMVLMLPPNTTALIQPMDMGIIYSVKARAKKLYYTQMINYDLTAYTDDPVTEFMKSYTLLDAIYHLDEAWKSIKPELIQKCYENLIDQKLFMDIQSSKNRNSQWQGLDFRGFEDTNQIRNITKKKQAILKRNKNTMLQLCEVDVHEIAEDVNKYLEHVGNMKKTYLTSVTATDILEDIEFNPLASLNYDDEIIDVLAEIDPTLVEEYEMDTEIIERPAHPYIESFNSLNSFKLQSEVMVKSAFNVSDKCRYNQLITELSEMISNYMNITKTVNVSKSTNVHALNEPSNEFENLHTEDMNVTHFRPLTKSLTKEEVDSDSDSSVAPDKLTSDHSSDNIVSDDDRGTEDISLEYSILPAVENDFIDD